jgi:uncharacterized protein (DUF1330 family)
MVAVIATIGRISLTSGDPAAMRTYHQLVFIWIRDPAMFAGYLRDLPPIVGRYGGAADLSLRPTRIEADGLTLPDVVNLVHYDDRQAYEAFNADADFARIEPLRAASVDLLTVEGYLTTSDPSPAGSPDRVYTVELANWRDGTGEAYRVDTERGGSRMGGHGHRVEYVLEARTAPAGRPRPDLVRISSFPDEAGPAPFETDPARTDHVIRLTGRAIG